MAVAQKISSRPGGSAELHRQTDHSRQRIQRAALGLFARYGYEGVSLQQIADAVGLHKSSLFHHYPGKSALFEDVLDHVVGRVLALVRPLDDNPPRLETLLEVLDSLVDHFCDEPEAARLLLAVMSAPDDSELRRGGSGDLEFYRVVASFLDRARKIGVIGRVHIRQAIPNLIGLVLVYPAVARDLAELVGKDPFSSRARQIRKEELARMIRALVSA
jgi:AcrR family transcriptional regulator